MILLVLPFVFYVSNAKESRHHNPVDKVIVWISAPVQWLVVGALEGITSTWHSYIALVDVQEENDRLRAENAELKGELAGREEQRLEIQRLRELVGVRERSGGVPMVFASIISTSPTPLFRSIRIDRGETDGIHLGAAVVNHEGVVGRVAGIGDRWADIMMIVDANSSVDVLVQRTRARARVRGTGGDSALGIEVEQLARTSDVQPGDVLITSGVGSVFPKGLRVGQVVSTETRAFGLYKQARAEPSVDFSRLEAVMVIPQGYAPDTDFDRDAIVVERGNPGAPE